MLGGVIAQATPGSMAKLRLQYMHELLGFLTSFFFIIKQAKMDFVFKLSFFSS